MPMEGCRIYHPAVVPADWRGRLELARRVAEHCAESATPVLTAQGRGLESLERVAATSPVQEVVLWGYLEAGSVRGVHRAAEALTVGKVVVYLACDRLDGEGRLHLGARAYGHPDPKQSTLMLTVPPFDRELAIASLSRMLETLRDCGHLGGDAFAAPETARALMTEGKEAFTVGDSEVRPIAVGDHPHMFRIVTGRAGAGAMMDALDLVLARCVGTADHVYLKLQGAAGPILGLQGLSFVERPHWRARYPLEDAERVERLMALGCGLSATYRQVRWKGQPESPYNEIELGLTHPAFTVSVSFAVDGDQVAACLQGAGVGFVRATDMPFD